MFSCFGLSILGMCAYDPGNPTAIYFTLGDVVAALSITLIIPQFLKPIFHFRLQSRRFPLSVLYLLVGLGVISVLVSSLLPHLPLTRNFTLAYPVFWEVAGALLFGAAYVGLALASIRPAAVRKGSYSAFVRGAAELLASADERDHIDFALDLSHNLESLFKSAAFLEIHQNPSPYFEFVHRSEIEDASYAASLLHIISDPGFCATLVQKCPWDTARILQRLSDQKLHVQAAEPFIQELTRQAIIAPQSMVAREIGFGGFSAAPLLSDTLFNSWFLASHYHPFQGLRYIDLDNLSVSLIDRIGHAAEAALKTVLSEKDYRNDRNFIHLQNQYHYLMLEIVKNARSKQPDRGLIAAIENDILNLIQITRNHLSSLSDADVKQLYAVGGDVRDFTILDVVAELFCETVFSFANDFESVGDPFWSFAYRIISETFPHYESEPSGMDPLQQRIALKMLDKLRDNMQGYYPALSRVLLGVIGPYGSFPKLHEMTAFRQLERALYSELKKYPNLMERKPDKATDFLPPNVRYEPETSALVHVYRNGNERETKLADLDIETVSFEVEQATSRSADIHDGVVLATGTGTNIGEVQGSL